MSFIKQLLLLLVLGGLAYGGWWGWQHYGNAALSDESASAKPRRAAPLVETAPATMSDIETQVDAVGSTRARQSVEITPLAPGRITEINFRAGKAIASGDVLLRLDDAIERADLIEATARLTEARSAFERVRSLKRSSSVADETVDRQVAALAIAQANLERVTKRLQERTVTAPFAGTVGFSRVELGARVEDGDTVTTLDDLSTVEIEFSLPEGLYGRIATGLRIVADAAAYPDRSFTGTIESIDSRIDAASRSFKVRAVVANPERLLPAGMFMHLVVVLEARRALTVPEEAIVVDGTQAYLFTVSTGDKHRTDGAGNKRGGTTGSDGSRKDKTGVLVPTANKTSAKANDGAGSGNRESGKKSEGQAKGGGTNRDAQEKPTERVSRRDVTLGQRSFGFVEILSGITENEEVVVRGVQRVRDGGPVRRAASDDASSKKTRKSAG